MIVSKNLPDGMSFVFDILNSAGSVVTTLVTETDSPSNALAEYGVLIRLPYSTLVKIGWKARELS